MERSTPLGWWFPEVQKVFVNHREARKTTFTEATLVEAKSGSQILIAFSDGPIDRASFRVENFSDTFHLSKASWEKQIRSEENSPKSGTST